jgi:hypothetical protein
MDNKFERVAPDSPDRCQGVTKIGQCPFKAKENSTFCPMHGGNKATDVAVANNIRQYRIAKFQARMDDFYTSPTLKTLREEIALLRMLIEERINTCNTSVELVMASPVIADLISRVERVVTSCNKLENNLGQLLDKTTAISLADGIVNIVTGYISDPLEREKIAFDVARLIMHVGSKDDEDSNI